MKHSKEEFELSTSVIEISMIIIVFTTRTNNGLGCFFSLLILIQYQFLTKSRCNSKAMLRKLSFEAKFPTMGKKTNLPRLVYIS